MTTAADVAGEVVLPLAPAHYERHRSEQTTLYRVVQQHAATFFAQAQAASDADLPQL